MSDLDLADVDAHRRAGVTLDHLHTARTAHQRGHRRPPALSAREALAALQFEALVVWTAAHNVAHGVELLDVDLERLTVACRRIDVIAEEAIG